MTHPWSLTALKDAQFGPNAMRYFEQYLAALGETGLPTTGHRPAPGRRLPPSSARSTRTPPATRPPSPPRRVVSDLESCSANSEASTAGDCHRSIAATSLGVAGRMEGHAHPFSKQTNCFSSPSARGTWSFLDRRKPPRKCRLKECSPGETWYTLICLGEMAPTFEPSRKTLTPPIAGLRRWARPSRDAARTTARVGNAGQIRFGVRHSWMVAPPLVAATTSDLSPSWFIVLCSWI